MGRRKAPGKKRKVQCSPECVLPVLNVSASGSQINAERDHELLSGNQPSMILLSMLEELEAKLDNLQNTLEDVPSRVAGLMEQIWIEKGQHHLENGGVSLGMVSPVTVRDSSFSRSPPIDLSVRSRELNQCLQPTSPRLLEPQKSQSLQPMSLDGHGLQQDCTISRGPSLDVSVIQGETNLRLPQTFDDEEEPLQAHCTQLEPEEHVKKEQLYADTWDPQQMDPPFHEGYEPQQNHSRQTVLPVEKETDVHIKQEELWFDGEAPQQNHCRQPAFQEEQSLQHNACLQQVLSDAQEQHQNCKTEPMQSEVQNADQQYKLEPLHPENCDQNYKQEPLHPEDRDENYEQEPLHPGDRDENYEQEPLHPEDRDETYEQEPLHPEDRDETSEQEPLHPEDRDENANLQRTCTDAQGPSVSSSFLAQNITDTDGAIATGALERRKSDVLLFKAIPGQQPQKESMDDQEKHKASRGVKYFAHKLNEKKHQTTHWGERVNNETLLLKQKRIDSGLGAYPWAECKKTFTGKTHLLLHEKTHTELRQCPYPEQETRSADEATLTHQEKTFVQKVHLQQHQKIHTRERHYHCNVCELSFPGKLNLVQHQRIHTGEKPYSCTACKKSFSLKRTLVDHQKIHSGEKPYSCTVCAKSFTLKTTLVHHQRIHTGEKPYSCTVCEKSFNRKKTLVDHQSTHTGEKPYRCTVCPKSYTRMANLLDHERIHTGERPYSCTVCAKSFTLKGTLLHHEARHAGKKP
ncbi:uncharacterized protein [Pleurodeles waltl]|uniref:uncharacterized protein n=1 Tax=Pleurodeles waltl TaxID=8319 RepID=UPI0037097241